MTDQIELISLKAGDKVDHYFILQKSEVKLSRTNKNYLDLEFRDKSALISGKIWDNFDNILLQLKNGCLVKVRGLIESYQGSNQLKIERIRIAAPEDNVFHEDFLPKSQKDFGKMKEELAGRIENIENVYLKKLLNRILTGEQFEKYLRVPAGKAWHHAYVHGLLEHTLEIIKICDLMCDIHPEINRDLLITGAVLHDFGKTEELTFAPTFDYTEKGRLLGHITIAAMEIEKQSAEIEDFPENLKNQLLHLVLSHQGKLEFATPVEPKTLEAITLYLADELSAKTNAYKNAIAEARASGELTGNFTKFIRLANTALYSPPDNSAENNEGEFKGNLFDQ